MSSDNNDNNNNNNVEKEDEEEIEHKNKKAYKRLVEKRVMNVFSINAMEIEHAQKAAAIPYWGVEIIVVAKCGGVERSHRTGLFYWFFKDHKDAMRYATTMNKMSIGANNYAAVKKVSCAEVYENALFNPDAPLPSYNPHNMPTAWKTIVDAVEKLLISGEIVCANSKLQAGHDFNNTKK